MVSVPLVRRELGWGYADRVWFASQFNQASLQAGVETMLALDALTQPVVGTSSEYLHIRFANRYGEKSFPIVEAIYISYFDEGGVEHRLVPKIADRDHGVGRYPISWVFRLRDLQEISGRLSEFVVDFGHEVCFVPISKRRSRPSKLKLLTFGLVATVVSVLFTERVKKHSAKGQHKQDEPSEKG